MWVYSTCFNALSKSSLSVSTSSVSYEFWYTFESLYTNFSWTFDCSFWALRPLAPSRGEMSSTVFYGEMILNLSVCKSVRYLLARTTFSIFEISSWLLSCVKENCCAADRFRGTLGHAWWHVGQNTHVWGFLAVYSWFCVYVVVLYDSGVLCWYLSFWFLR